MRKILITGGSGFLGRNLANSLKDESDVFLLSRNQKYLAEAANILGPNVKVYPGDVSNFNSINEAVLSIRPEIIVHGAATKFVGMAEQFPSECVDINVLGSKNVAMAAKFNGVSTVIGISTDKATSPIANIYGASKAIMERLFSNLDTNSDTKFVVVRYGNVAWSTGSVFPLWEEMSNTTKSVSTTGPNLSRFFFSIDEAVGLVRFAIENQEELRGKVLSLPMKGVEMSRVLDVWADVFKVNWVAGKPRPGDRDLEFLISESEFDRTKVWDGGSQTHFVLDLKNFKVGVGDLNTSYSSRSAPQLTDDEIRSLITSRTHI